MSDAQTGAGGTHGTRGTDLFFLRERILVHERIVARHEKRVAKAVSDGWKVRAPLDELRIAQKRLAELRSRLADSVREVMS